MKITIIIMGDCKMKQNMCYNNYWYTLFYYSVHALLEKN